MEAPIKAFFILILIATFSFLMLDFNSNISMKSDAYESTRAANQNALLDLQENYDNYEELNTPAMVERWLVNFLKNENIPWKDIDISFIQIENDPPTYLLEVKGHNKSKYAIVGKEAYVEFSSGTTLITDDRDKPEGN